MRRALRETPRRKAPVMSAARATPDALSAVLSTVRAESSRYGLSELAAPWGIHFGPRRSPVFHSIDRGEAMVTIDGDAEAIALAAGDSILLPHGDGHRVGDVTSGATMEVDFTDPVRIYERAKQGAERTTRFVCAQIELPKGAGKSVFSALPSAVVVRGASHEAGTLPALLATIAREADRDAPGGREMIHRLLETAFLETLRIWLGKMAIEAPGWLRGIQDPLVAKALELFHAKPGAPHELASVARAVGASRTVFARRFAERVGEPPMNYLARLRVERAAHVLRAEPEQSLEDVAQAFGYASQASFSRAFKRFHGVAPASARRARSA